MNTTDNKQEMQPKKPRWQYRFNNFKRAYFLLQEAADKYHEGTLEQLAKEGMIHGQLYETLANEEQIDNI